MRNINLTGNDRWILKKQDQAKNEKFPFAWKYHYNFEGRRLNPSM